MRPLSSRVGRVENLLRKHRDSLSDREAGYLRRYLDGEEADVDLDWIDGLLERHGE